MVRERIVFFTLLVVVFSCNKQSKEDLEQCYKKQKNIYKISNSLVVPQSAQDLYDLIYQYRGTDYNKTKQYINDLRILSEDLDFSHGKAKAYYMDGYLSVIHKYDYENGLKNYEQALCIYEAIGDKQGMAECYAAIGSAYYSNALYDAALISYNKALAWWKLLGNKTYESAAHRGLGMTYSARGEYEVSIENHTKALRMREAMKDEQGQGIAESCNDLGGVYYLKKQFYQALDYFNQSLSSSEKLKNKKYIANALNNIALIYKELNDYEKAMDGFMKSLYIERQLKNSLGVVQSYFNIGSTEVLANRIEKGINWLKQAEELAKDFGDKSILANIKEELSLAYEKLGNQEQTKLYKKESDHLQREQLKLARRQERTRFKLQVYALEYISTEKEKSTCDSLYQKKEREEEQLMYPSYK